MQSTMENRPVKSYERGKQFRDFQVWPLSTELDYDGWLRNFSNDSDRVLAEHILDFFTYYSKKMVNQMLATSVGGAGRILKDYYANWTHSHFKQKCIYSFIPGEVPNDSDYNTPANSDHRVSLTKTLKFTHYVKDKKETQCCLQSPSGYRGNQRTGDTERTGQTV